MKYGETIIDLRTGRRGPLVARHRNLRGVWVWLDGRREYVREWAKACQWPKRAIWKARAT